MFSVNIGYTISLKYLVGVGAFFPEEGGRLLPYISHIGMCRAKGKGFCPGGILRISRHSRDDLMGLKITPSPPKNTRAFNKTHKKSLDQKWTPQKNPMPNFWALENLQKGQQVCLLNFNCRTSGRDLWALSGIFRLLLFPLKSSHPKKILAKFYYPQKIPESKIFWEGRFGLKTGIDFAYRVYMVFEGTTGVYERPQRRWWRWNRCFRRLSFKW